jgi:hypothetical protein
MQATAFGVRSPVAAACGRNLHDRRWIGLPAASPLPIPARERHGKNQINMAPLPTDAMGIVTLGG